MTNLIEIIHELRQTRGTNSKKRVLSKYQNNDLWKQYLVAVYDSGVNYGVSSPGDRTFIQEANVDSLLLQLPRLTERELTGNAARHFAQMCSEEYGELFRIILDGSLKAGVSITTINQIYPGLIPTYPVMLAKAVDNPRYPLLASTKYDGVRVIVRVEGGKARPITRAGKFLGLTSLIRSMESQTDGVYDGELVYGDGRQAGRTKITGYVNRVLKGGLEDFDDYTFVIFDKISLDEWDTKSGSIEYATRMRHLSDEYNCYPNLWIATQMWVDEPSQVNRMFQEHLALGWEGLILRDPSDPYVWKRSDRLIKMKATKECLLRCVDTVEGTGKYAYMIGSLVCEGVVEGKEIRVNLGTGLSDHDRSQLPEYYIGKHIECAYNDIVKAEKAVCHSLFLPRFKRVVKDYNI